MIPWRRPLSFPPSWRSYRRPRSSTAWGPGRPSSGGCGGGDPRSPAARRSTATRPSPLLRSCRRSRRPWPWSLSGPWAAWADSSSPPAERRAPSSGSCSRRGSGGRVAAALGYGLGLASERNVMVVDIGGGTMNVALVRLRAGGLRQGRAEVLAKQGRACGGNAVDSWVLDHVCRRMGYALDELSEQEEVRLWRRMMLAEACRVKEAVFFLPSAEFLLTPPGLARRVRAGAPGSQAALLSRDDLVEVLREGVFYASLSASVEQVLSEGPGGPIPTDDVHDILMVGGSTLLPGVFPLLEQRFGRHRVRAWQPFEAVAFGAASFAADRYVPHDYIVHDYAFVTHDAGTRDPVYTVVVPRGTRFPTSHDFWKARLVATCSLGEPEALFKLVVCETGRTLMDRQAVVRLL